jgi:hypothetical protein
VHEFLGSMSYPLGGKIKIVQFWRMRASGRPVRDLMSDVKAVKWLSLTQAIDTLTRAHEKVFLANVGPVALKAAKQSMQPVRHKTPKQPTRSGGKRRSGGLTIVPANDDRAGPRNPFVKALGRWIDRVSQPSRRRTG